METDFIGDHHTVSFRLEGDSVVVSDVHCPYEGTTGSLCRRLRSHCVVQRFIGVYGVEINVGSVDINGPVEIAWCGQVGTETDLDPEFSGMWIIPVQDDLYAEASID